jgi:hypothetical protein
VAATEGTGADNRRADMTKFIHICASENDLFALDDEGEVFQYDFNAKSWVKLSPSRSQDGSQDEERL